MSSGLDIKINLENNIAEVILAGRIDEDANFEALTSCNADSFHLNFSGVSLINSCGVRELINLVTALTQKSKIIYKSCPQIMIEQMNMVEGFLPSNASIESFYAPYFDPDADEEIKVLLKSDEISNKKAPTKKNDSGTELEFDALEAQYFNFIK